MSYNREKLQLVLIYVAFGTVGLVSHFIMLSSTAIVFYRAILGALFIILATILSGGKINLDSMKNNFLILMITGFFMGFNWVFQFAAFRVSSVAIGTVCYNMMPIFFIILSAFIFKEKIKLKSVICILIASVGIILVSNVLNTGISSAEVLGCVFGMLGAVFYALILIFNKLLKNIEMHDKIVFQFLFSAFIMAIYILFISRDSFLFEESIGNREMMISIICILILGLFHTGFCYVRYFNAVVKLDARTVAIMTYIDPVVALFLSFFVLKESMHPLQFLGAFLILFSTMLNQGE